MGWLPVVNFQGGGWLMPILPCIKELVKVSTPPPPPPPKSVVTALAVAI